MDCVWWVGGSNQLVRKIQTQHSHFSYQFQTGPQETAYKYGEANLALYRDYVSFHRKRYSFTIAVDGHVAQIEVRADYTPPLGKSQECRFDVDLQHPNSLQKLFEFVMGKRWK